MRKENLGLVLAAMVALTIGLAPSGWSQSDDTASRKLGGLFSQARKKMDAQRAKTSPAPAATPGTPAPTATVTPVEGGAKPSKPEDDLVAAAAGFLESAEGKAMKEKAEQALAGKKTDELEKALAGQNTDELMKKAQGLIGDPKAVDSILEQGNKLGGAQGLPKISKQQLEQAQGMIGSASAADLAKAAEGKIPQLKPVAGQTHQPVMTTPGNVPVPQDPIAQVIPRPTFNAATMTKITADKAEFNANTNQVTFEGHVLLDHPEFDMSCSVLVAYLKSDGSAPAGVSPTQVASAGGIDRAVATGYVEIEKLAPDGKYQVAKSRNAIFEATTGDVTLTDFPSLQDGTNLIRGTTEATKIFLRQNGKYNVDGPADYSFDPGTKSGATQFPR